MSSVSKDTAATKVAWDGVDIDHGDLEGGYAVCFERHTGTARVPDAELQRIDSPAALLWGRHDRMTPLSLAAAASTRLGWPLHLIDHAAHVPHIEQPEGFVDRLTDILRGDSTATVGTREAVG